MRIRFEQYCDELVPAVRAFNRRLDAAGVESGYRLGAVPDPVQPYGDTDVYKTTFLAVDGPNVRGSITLQHQPFVVAGIPRQAVNIQLPLSEGLGDKRYAFIGMWLIKNVVQRHPFCFAVGMGGLSQPLPKLLLALHWDVRPVPFFFYVHRVQRFLRGMPRIRSGRLRRLAADAAAYSGVGWFGLRLLERIRSRRTRAAVQLPLTMNPEYHWGPWADELWKSAFQNASAIGVRSGETLPTLYPPGDRYLLFRLAGQGRTVGWVVLLNTRMKGNSYFGDLRVGTILDALCIPGYEDAAAYAIRRVLDRLDVDVSICNHAHASWQAALHASGYRSGPSNYLLAMSKQLSDAVLGCADHTGHERIHLTRGDGDGRIHL